jgi:tetratricopeptide (TPR) repeat protein
MPDQPINQELEALELNEEAQEALRLLEQGQADLETAAGVTPEEALKLCDQALALFKQARELAVEHPRLNREARVAVATAYSQRGHQQRYNRNFAGSLADLTQGLRLNPTNAEDYYYRALSHLGNGDPRQARLDLVEYLKRGENDYLREQARHRLTELAPGKDDPIAGSLHWRNEGMRLNGNASEAIQPRGEGAKPDWLTAVRLYNQAIEAFNRALELNPADRIIRIGLMTALKDQAEAYRQLDEYDLALANYDRALETQPDTRFIFFKAETLFQAGHIELAKTIFQEYLAVGKDPGLRARTQSYLTARPGRVTE